MAVYLFIRGQRLISLSMRQSVFDGRKKNGLGFALEAGFLVGSQSSEYNAPFSFNFLASYTANTKNLISLGSGVEFIGRPYTPLVH